MSKTVLTQGALTIEMETDMQHVGSDNSGNPEEETPFLREGMEQSSSGKASQERYHLD